MTKVVKCDGDDTGPAPSVHKSSEVCLAGGGITSANMKDDSFPCVCVWVTVIFRLFLTFFQLKQAKPEAYMGEPQG